MSEIKSKNQLDKIKIKRLKLILPIFVLTFVVFIIYQYLTTKKVFVVNDSDMGNYSRFTLD